MRYHLLFAIKLKWEESGVIYDPNGFADTPVVVSVPEITNMVKYFVSKFNLVAIVEPQIVKKDQIKKVAEDDNTSSESLNKNKPCKDELDKSASPLRGVAAEAHICHMKNLDRSSFERLRSELTNYITKCCSEISQEKILSSELDPCFAGIREAVELRNYLSRFVESNKKIYQNGYIYIMVI